MHILDGILMHMLDVLKRMHILDVLLRRTVDGGRTAQGGRMPEGHRADS